MVNSINTAFLNGFILDFRRLIGFASKGYLRGFLKPRILGHLPLPQISPCEKGHGLTETPRPEGRGILAYCRKRMR